MSDTMTQFLDDFLPATDFTSKLTSTAGLKCYCHQETTTTTTPF